MAIFRKVHVSFWKDPFVEGLTPEKKFFYLYLLTNERTKQCGIYEVTIKQMCYDTGYNEDTVKKLIQYFIFVKKIKYNEKTSEVALKNWPKYNDSHSPQVRSCIQKELKEVKDTLLIQYLYSTDTPLKEEQEQEQEQEEPDTQVDSKMESALEIVSYLNAKAGKAFKPTSKPTVEKIRARIKEGHSVEDFKKVIDTKVKQWNNDLKMQAFLRPETLFGSKFESYLNEVPINGSKRQPLYSQTHPEVDQW